MSEQDRLPWETEGDLPWEVTEPEWDAPESTGWRGEQHTVEWPEHLAGPEYWLFKGQDERN